MLCAHSSTALLDRRTTRRDRPGWSVLNGPLSGRWLSEAQRDLESDIWYILDIYLSVYIHIISYIKLSVPIYL